MHFNKSETELRAYDRRVFRHKLPRKGNPRAYLAGFFDADGTISASQKTGENSFSLIVALYNTNLEFLKWAQTLIGGQIFDRPRTQNPKQIQRMLRLTNIEEQFDFLNQIYPHLRIKKKAVEFGIRYIISRKRMKHLSHPSQYSIQLLRDLRKENKSRSYHSKDCPF